MLATIPADVLDTRLAGDPERDRDWWRGSFPLAPWAGALDAGTFDVATSELGTRPWDDPFVDLAAPPSVSCPGPEARR